MIRAQFVLEVVGAPILAIGGALLFRKIHRMPW